jgi:alpha-mannosidase
VQAEKCYSIDDEEPTAAAGHEADFQHFLRFSQRGGERAFAVVSHGTHAYSHLRNKVRLNILRSCGYATHSEHLSAGEDRYLNRYIPRQDQGPRTARFTFLFGKRAATTDETVRGAYEANLPLEAFVYFPTARVKGRPVRASFASVNAKNVVITALKRGESGEDLVMRLWETAGRKTACTLAVEGKKFRIVIGAWRLKTLRLNRAGKLTETDLIEEAR